MFWRKNIAHDVEPSKIFIDRGDFIDINRNNRKIPYKLYYPKLVNKDQKLPLVIWSHGFGGSRDGAGYLARFLASHNYIILNVQHHGTDSTLWEGKPEHPWEILKRTKVGRKTTLDRMRDIPFVIDMLEQGNEIKPDILDMIDLSNIGMSGHSFGSITTQIMSGQLLGKRNRKYSMKEDRIKASIAYSPSPTYNHKEDHSQIYGAIDLPMFYMTGTKDGSPVMDHDYQYRVNIYNHAQGNDQHLLILNDGDHMVYNGSRGGLGNNPKLELHKDIIKISALAFWDAYLKNDKNAFDWLSGSPYSEYLGKEGVYENKNMEK